MLIILSAKKFGSFQFFGDFYKFDNHRCESETLAKFTEVLICALDKSG